MEESKPLSRDFFSRKKLQTLTEKCKEKGIGFSPLENSKYEIYKFSLSKKNFSDLDIFIADEKDTDLALSIDWDALRGLDTLAGYVDIKNQLVEVSILGSSVFGSIDKNRLFGPGKNQIVLKSSSGGPTIEIGEESGLCAKLRGTDAVELSVKIYGLVVRSAEEAENQIKKHCSQIFFEILKERSLGLRLRRRIRRGLRIRIKERILGESALPEYTLRYPTQALPFIPVALLAAAEDPLLPPSFNFLLNYQAVEFFLFRANRIEALDAIRSIVEDAKFDSSSDKDINKIISAMKPQWINATKRELEQISTLINNDNLLDKLRSFLSADVSLKEHLSKAHKFTSHVVDVSAANGEFAKVVASRVYEIRNSIVHAKEDENEKRPLLLLQSSDEEIIDLDAFFLNTIAKEVLQIFGNDGPL